MRSFSAQLQEHALDLTWSLWAELGVSGWRRRHTSHSIDPEPLILFTAMLRKGRRVRWVVNYSDERNHDLFEMDRRWLYHTVVRNGRKNERPRVAHNLGDWQHCTVQVEVSSGAIIHRVRRGEEWVTLVQTPGEPGRDYTQGKFGFYIPGDDQIGLSNFRYTRR